MIISIRHGRDMRKIENVTNYILCDEQLNTLELGLEYMIDAGTAWTLTSSADDDFFKIVSMSGHERPPSCVKPTGQPQLVCIQKLGCGLIQVVNNPSMFLISTDQGQPMRMILRDHGGYVCRDYDDPEFHNRLRVITHGEQAADNWPVSH